jgi:hypothetical protein
MAKSDQYPHELFQDHAAFEDCHNCAQESAIDLAELRLHSCFVSSGVQTPLNAEFRGSLLKGGGEDEHTTA